MSTKNLNGKYCVVTGAGKGIGRAIAERFLEEQAAVDEVLTAFGQIDVLVNNAATKAALQGFTRTPAKELAAKNVRMNCVAPAYVDTEMMRAIGEEKLNAMISRSPAKRMCQPSEIAAVVTFLATDDASWITGQTIFASGGSTCS